MKRVAVLLLAICILPGAGIRRPVLNVAGLRLGMTAAQVLAELHARHLKVHTTYSPCFDDYLAQHRKVVPIGDSGRCLQSIWARYAGGDLLVFLSEELPNHPGRARVYTLALNYVAASAVSAVMRQAGTPTLTDGKRPWTVAMWCFDFKCTTMSQALNKHREGEWLLVHRGAGLTLLDNTLNTEPLLVEMLAKHGVRLEP